jgi:predicted RNA binding protein YcfA (HicA-like mRNA interferase family)
MPSLSELPGELKRKKFAKALKRLGFIIDKTGGNGSHYKVVWPSTQKAVTIQAKLRKDVLYYVIKEIDEISDITWGDIKKEL